MTTTASRRTHCQELLEELFHYLDGELSPARCRAIERHLADCPCCGRLAARVRRAISVCQAAGKSRLPPSVRRQARTRIEALLAAPQATGGPTAGGAAPADRRNAGASRAGR